MEENLWELFAAGKIHEIIKKILPSPDASLDTLNSDDPLFPYLLNYFDAAIFKTYPQALCASECLSFLIEQLPRAQPYHMQILPRLEYEQQVLRTLLTEFSLPGDSFFKLLEKERRGKALGSVEFTEIWDAIPHEYRQLLGHQQMLGQGWLAYQQHKSAPAEVLQKADLGFTRPWLAINYAMQEVVQLPKPFPRVPLIFLDPFRMDYEALLSPLKDVPALFVFETRAKLIQQLQFQSVVEALCMPHHLVYVMEVYPNSQFAVQDIQKIQGQKFDIFCVVDRPAWRSGLPLVKDAIQKCLRHSLIEDTEAGNWLYQTAKRMLFTFEEERLGISRAMALHEYMSGKQWHDPHKGLPLAGKSLGTAPIDYQKIKLSSLAERRRPRTKGSGKIRLVHVVPQIVDEGHAPSRLLENLVIHHDKERFELFVISTERLQFHWLEYPYNLYTSEPSNERGPRRITAFQKHACQVQILNGIQSYEQTAVQVARYMEQSAADIVVFHGPDVINTMTAQLTDVPMRVLFDHGTLPSYAGYDLVLASTPVTSQKYVELFKEWKTEIKELPFAVDAKRGWLKQPFGLENWGVPAGSLIMTTISQHLDNRLSSEMLLAIAEILKRIPKAYYIPIGKITNLDRFISFFKKHHVYNRVIFMGPVECPSQYARSMCLYLNEFPFGSGLGMLDAMASGCPVVSMYDPKGPPQARYGGQYMGVEWTIASGKRSDYVDLACRLLTDEALYKEWSEQALRQYQRYADVKGYVQAFEAIMIQALCKR